MVTGEVMAYLDVLSLGWHDPRVSAVLAGLGSAQITDSDSDGVPVRRARFTDTGVALTFRQDRLASIVFTVSDGPTQTPGSAVGTVRRFGREPRTPYPRIDHLIDGITGQSTRADLRALLGEPLRSWFAYDEYLIRTHVLSGTFYGQHFDDFREVTLLAEDPIVLRYDIPWSPVARRRDDRLFLSVPVSLGIADTVREFEISDAHVQALRDPDRFALLRHRLEGKTDWEAIRGIIDDVCRT